MEAGDLLRLKQATTRTFRKHQGDLFIVVHSDAGMTRVMVQSLKSGKRRRLSKNRFEVISGSRRFGAKKGHIRVEGYYNWI